MQRIWVWQRPNDIAMVCDDMQQMCGICTAEETIYKGLGLGQDFIKLGDNEIQSSGDSEIRGEKVICYYVSTWQEYEGSKDYVNGNFLQAKE
jgi:hypothetical protein